MSEPTDRQIATAKAKRNNLRESAIEALNTFSNEFAAVTDETMTAAIKLLGELRYCSEALEPLDEFLQSVASDDDLQAEIGS